MPDTVTIQDLSKHVDKEVTINCWMYNKRGGKGIFFLQLRDGTATTQGIVFDKSEETELYKTADTLTMESSITVTGKVAKHPKKEEYEVQVTAIEIITLA